MFIWTIWDALAVMAALAFCFWCLFFAWPIAMRQWQCSHDGDVTETRACDAICVKCGKNLGFIGNRVMDQRWREKHSDGDTSG